MSRESPRGSFFGAISPWNTSKNATPQSASVHPHDGQDVLTRSQGEDHTITHRNRLSLHRYPKDCPPLKVRWFYAVDSPKRKPRLPEHQRSESKPLPPPKKFVPFSSRDSQAIETEFQKLSDIEVARKQTQHSAHPAKAQNESTRVPVNEDFLFDVDIERRELTPAYWLGPVYEVRRGTWFFQEGYNFKPCEENLATQLEEGYLKIRPWRFENAQRTVSQPSSNLKAQAHEKGGPNTIKDQDSLSSTEPSSSHNYPEHAEHTTSTRSTEPQNYRLFGSYMNSIVTYQDASTALLTNDDFMSRMSTTVYQKLGGVAGTKVVRGFTEIKKQKEASDMKGRDPKPTPGSFSVVPETILTELEENPISESLPSGIPGSQGPKGEDTVGKDPRSTLERQMSSLAGEVQNTAELEEQARREEEKEMEDSREADDEDREREIDHLVLVTHGIGQRLGLRLESINFIHDVSVLRKTMKSVYKASPDLQIFNSAFADGHKNCRIQVLPVCWRYLLDFPYQTVRQNRKERDLADADLSEDVPYPSLADITLDSVPAVRNLISDLAMDVLLYQSAYRENIGNIVKQECNRILKLFKQRNPSFKGSVSLCGHSLGSAILFDILCHQQSDIPSFEQKGTTSRVSQSYSLDFECEEFFCLGSPIALFQMLKGNIIAGRPTMDGINSKNSANGKVEENLESSSTASMRHSAPTGTGTGTALGDGPGNVSSPKCRQLYNIFHPSDPVSYRIEPLISPAMSSLKPQPLPSVKRGLWAAPGQSLSIIGSRVGQSVGSLWTNFTTGVASSLLNRSLGLSSEEVPPQSTNTNTQLQQPQSSLVTDSTKEKRNSAESLRKSSDRHRTLIDSELETLYDGFQNTRINDQKPASHSLAEENIVDDQETEDRLKKLKIEDAKVRALNSNGRVDYSIQEGAFDISLIASIASHLTYWADEDVNHFILSQMLSRKDRYQNK